MAVELRSTYPGTLYCGLRCRWGTKYGNGRCLCPSIRAPPTPNVTAKVRSRAVLQVPHSTRAQRPRPSSLHLFSLPYIPIRTHHSSLPLFQYLHRRPPTAQHGSQILRRRELEDVCWKLVTSALTRGTSKERKKKKKTLRAAELGQVLPNNPNQNCKTDHGLVKHAGTGPSRLSRRSSTT